MTDEKKDEKVKPDEKPVNALCATEDTDADELAGDPVKVNEWGDEDL